MRLNRKNSQFSTALLLGALTIACVAFAWPRMRRQLAVNSLTHSRLSLPAGQQKALRLLGRLAPGTINENEEVRSVIWLDRERRIVVVSSGENVKALMITPTGHSVWTTQMRLLDREAVANSHYGFECLSLRGEISTVHLAIAGSSLVPVRYEVVGQVTPLPTDISLEKWMTEGLYSEDVVRQLHALTATPADLSSEDRSDLEPRLSELRQSEHPWVRQAARALSRPYVVPAFARVNTWSDWIDD